LLSFRKESVIQSVDSKRIKETLQFTLLLSQTYKGWRKISVFFHVKKFFQFFSPKLLISVFFWRIKRKKTVSGPYPNIAARTIYLVLEFFRGRENPEAAFSPDYSD